MAEFIRARSAEQKEQRLAEIKGAASRQFSERPYHEITLSTIADELGWSRANLYKYVGTKEEIFLLLAGDECNGYFDALLAALPVGCGLAPQVIAEVWAGIANAHQEYFRLGDLLSTIVETNASVERVAAFKRGYYACVDRMSAHLPQILDIAPDRVEPLLVAIYYHAVGYVTACWKNPTVAQALTEIGRARPATDFRAEMSEFIGMCLAHYSR